MGFYIVGLVGLVGGVGVVFGGWGSGTVSVFGWGFCYWVGVGVGLEGVYCLFVGA